MGVERAGGLKGEVCPQEGLRFQFPPLLRAKALGWVSRPRWIHLLPNLPPMKLPIFCGIFFCGTQILP